MCTSSSPNKLGNLWGGPAQFFPIFPSPSFGNFWGGTGKNWEKFKNGLKRLEMTLKVFWDTFGKKYFWIFFTLEGDPLWDLENFGKISKKIEFSKTSYNARKWLKNKSQYDYKTYYCVWVCLKCCFVVIITEKTIFPNFSQLIPIFPDPSFGIFRGELGKIGPPPPHIWIKYNLYAVENIGNRYTIVMNIQQL